MPGNQRCEYGTFCRHQLRMSALLRAPCSTLGLQMNTNLSHCCMPMLYQTPGKALMSAHPLSRRSLLLEGLSRRWEAQQLRGHLQHE